ncbi:MAG TPA: hypothetical protein VN043_06395, partial [Rhodanobacter sp.]|nr:hypothetical protein [Rhodanobacter sp.]
EAVNDPALTFDQPSKCLRLAERFPMRGLSVPVDRDPHAVRDHYRSLPCMTAAIGQLQPFA